MDKLFKVTRSIGERSYQTTNQSSFDHAASIVSQTTKAKDVSRMRVETREATDREST